MLLERIPSAELTSSFVRGILKYFEETRVQFTSGDMEMSGWSPESSTKPAQAYRRYTAEAVIALERINRMLDERINQVVFGHFAVRYVTSPRLNDLFIGDIGLCQAPEKGPTGVPLRRPRSIGLLLERMRAHVLGIKPLSEEWDPLYSMVLHGPPGTGKTTLAEALAASCNVPLVEITPSDLVVAGAEAVERRARCVFRALSLLTRAVVLFDEFDPVLARRNLEETTPRSVFSFLTPGMLPKLKNLTRSAGGRRVAYFLITNMIGKLDPAAVRTGRFDSRIGIYPPDLLSRVGQLVTEFLRYCDGKDLTPPRDFEERLSEVIRKTAGLPMEFLARRGWFLRPLKGGGARSGTPFAFLLGDAEEPSWPEPEAEEPKDPPSESGPAATQEFEQWKWVIERDQTARNEGKSLESIIVLAVRSG